MHPSLHRLLHASTATVDILTDTEEQTLEAITGCFAAAGGVPEVGILLLELGSESEPAC